MDRMLIHGGKPLNGHLRISGAKNSALPILIASILSEEAVVIENIPHLKDITTTLELLGHIGTEIIMDDQMCIQLQTRDIKKCEGHYDLVKSMRASILILGPLLARHGKATVSMPGGCAIGTRPVDIHLEAFIKMGADISLEGGYIIAKAKKMQGKQIDLTYPTVTGTLNIMMVATLAKGETVITNAAQEPEIEDVANFLNAMGAQISGAGTKTIRIEGVENPFSKKTRYRVLPDRVEAGTYLTATAMTTGEITVYPFQHKILPCVLEKLQEAGAEIKTGKESITLSMNDRPKAVNLTTAPFPGFPTDLQAQFTAMNCIAEGQGEITETIFENRFMHVQELVRMGSNLTVKGNKVVSSGVDHLIGAPVMATDLRASASLILAGLAARGETIIDRIYHIDRGYETIEEKLASLGACIKRITNKKT